MLIEELRVYSVYFYRVHGLKNIIDRESVAKKRSLIISISYSASQCGIFENGLMVIKKRIKETKQTIMKANS